MAEWLRCDDCGAQEQVSDEDPDATVAEMLAHVESIHGLSPLYGDRDPLRVVREPADTGDAR